MEKPYLSKTVVALIPLEYTHIKNPIEGVKKKLEEHIHKWNEDMKGVLQSFSHVSITDHKARILDEFGYLLVNIEYQGDYFLPRRGQMMKGTVTSFDSEQIALLVDVFNAVIPKENAKPWRFKDGKWLLGSRSLDKGDNLKFVIEE